MWISRQITNGQDRELVQSGRVTLNTAGQVEAVSTGAERNVNMYSPFGYSFSVPSGCEVLLTNSDGQKAALGVLMENDGLACGEIKISSPSGAYILLKNNGSVVINGKEIDKSGVIK